MYVGRNNLEVDRWIDLKNSAGEKSKTQNRIYSIIPFM